MFAQICIIYRFVINLREPATVSIDFYHLPINDVDEKQKIIVNSWAESQQHHAVRLCAITIAWIAYLFG